MTDLRQPSAAAGPTASSPLRGVTVLELAQFIAGPFAGQQLADLGAEVVKIERPGSGDPFRQYVTSPSVDGYGHNFCAFNRNKLGITLDLHHPRGREVFKRLVRGADVVLDNFRAGVLDRLGLGYAELQALNPRLISCSISGFSADGPYRDRPAFDTIGQSLSGILHLFLDPQQPRMRGPTVADQAASLQASNAIVAALFARERIGVGARIEVSMLDAAIAFMPDAFTAYTQSGIESGPETRVSYSHSFVFRCADDAMLGIHVGGPDHFWKALVVAAEAPEIAADPRFADRMGRIANFSALVEAFAAIFRTKPRAYWLDRMAQCDVPASEVLSIPEVLKDPEVRHSAIFAAAEHPEFGPMTVMRRAARIDHQRDQDRRLPPTLGEHTEEVLRRASYGDAEISELRAQGII